MSFESSIASVLRKDPADKISFKIDGLLDHGLVVVDKKQMEGVAAAIEKKDIDVVVGGAGGFDAAYSSWRTRRLDPGERPLIGKLTVRNVNVVNTSMGKAAVFHESVHALMDVNKHKISNHNDEVVAYLADALYLKAVKHTNLAGGANEMAIYNAAFALVDKHRMLKRPGTKLGAADCDALRSAIKSHPLYSQP
jgi:hypothetical protein